MKPTYTTVTKRGFNLSSFPESTKGAAFLHIKRKEGRNVWAHTVLRDLMRACKPSKLTVSNIDWGIKVNKGQLNRCLDLAVIPQHPTNAPWCLDGRKIEAKMSRGRVIEARFVVTPSEKGGFYLGAVAEIPHEGAPPQIVHLNIEVDEQ
jgi:hypothetical protein